MSRALLILVAAMLPVVSYAACPFPQDGEMCLSPDVFTGPLRCLATPDGCSANPQQRELVCNLPTRKEYFSSATPCLVLSKATGEYCPKLGRYHVWRNLSYDIWVRLPDQASPEDAVVGNALLGLKDLLKIVFQDQVTDESAYDDVQVTPAPLVFDGTTCLPRGFTLGSGVRGGAAQQVSPAEFVEFLKGLRELQQKLKGLRTECEKNPGGAACKELTSDELVRKSEDLKKMLAEAARARATAQDQAQAEGVVDDPKTPQDEKAQAQEKAAKAAAENAAAESGEPNDSSEESAGPPKPVEGSGGVLPAGAPPWLADLFDMVLTYFGVSESIKGAALVLYIFAPELLDQLASLTANLTKDLANEDLDKAFADIAAIYRFYQAATTAAASLEKFATDGGYKNAADLLTRSGKLIDALPDKMQEDLRQAVGEDITNGLSKVKNVAGAVDPATVEAIVSGKGRAALIEQLERKARDTLVDSAAKELGREIGINPDRLKGAIGAVARGDYDGAQVEARKAFSTEVAQRIGVDPALVDSIVGGTATQSQVRNLIADRATAVVAKSMGLPNLSTEQISAIASDLQAGRVESLGETALNQLPEADRTKLSDAFNIAQSDNLSAELQARARAELLQRVPADYRQAFSDGLNPRKVADQLLTDRLGVRYTKLRDAVEKDGAAAAVSSAAQGEFRKVVAAHAGEFPETAALLRGKGSIDNTSLLATLQRDTATTTQRVVGSALKGEVYLGLDRANLPSELARAIASLPEDPKAALEEARKLADRAIKANSEIVYRKGATNAVLTCANLSEWTSAGATDPKLGAKNPTSILLRMFNTAPPALLPPESVKSLIAARCPVGANPRVCATNVCAGVRDVYVKNLQALSGYTLAGPGGAGGNLPIEKAVLVTTALEDSPQLAQFARSAPAFAKKGMTTQRALGALVSSGLPPMPSESEIIDVLAKQAPEMAAALQAAVAGDIGGAGRLILAKLLGDQAALVSADETIRAAALKAWLEAPPRSVVGITEAAILACQRGAPTCLAESKRMLREGEADLAADMAVTLAPTVKKLVAASEESCIGVLEARELGAPAPTFTLGAAAFQPLIRGRTSPEMSRLALRVLCCRDAGSCSAADVSKAAGIVVQRQFGLLPEVANSESLRQLIVAAGTNPASVLAPAAAKVQQELVTKAKEAGIGVPAIKGTLMDTINAGVYAAMDVGRKNGERLAKEPQVPSQGTAMALILMNIDKCARQPRPNSSKLCAGPDAWKDGECAERLKQCGKTVEWTP